jgi:hypothetical protein
VTTV